MLKRLLPPIALALVTVLVPATPSSATDWVVKLQKRLNAMGCSAGPADGKLGDWTRSGVVRFQSRHRLTMDGVPGPVTRKRLYAKTAQRCDNRPVPKASGVGRRIVISQRQNWIWIVGPKGKVVAQGGMIDNPAVLRPGTYRTGSYCGRAARIERNGVESGLLWLDNFVRFAPCGVGMHRIPRYISTGQQMHADWLLGTNYRESHGCIRLSNGMSERVWDFTKRPTTVRVVTG
jgi:Putative peptidoglycan binding domain/L,D-transpeptidase catalytic domain